MKEVIVMKKYLVMILFVFFSFLSFSEITDVKLYFDRALVTRSIAENGKDGINEIVFKNIPKTVLPDSFVAKCEALSKDSKVKILDIKAEKVFSNQYSKEIEELKSQLQKEKISLQKEILAKERIDLQKKSMDLFSKNIKDATLENLSKGSFNAKQWDEALNLYALRLEKLDDNLLEINSRIENIKERITLLELKLKQYANYEALYSFDVYVKIELTKVSTVKIDLSYMIMQAGWRPVYDIRYDSNMEKELQLDYNAFVYQLTGENWNDVILTLSTARPDISTVVPDIEPWELDFAKVAKRAINSKALMAESLPDLDAKKEMASSSFNETQISTTKLSVEYRIPCKVNVSSEKKETKVTIANNTKLKSELRWIAIPRESKYAFLLAKVKNSTAFTFLSGDCNLYIDGSFVGKSYIDEINPDMEFDISLGRDSSVVTDIKLDLREKSRLFSKNREKRRYILTIKNNRKEDINILIKDVLPKSLQLDKINVKILKLEPDTKNIDRGSIYSWEFKIIRNSEIKIVEEWEVEYTNDGDIIGL